VKQYVPGVRPVCGDGGDTVYGGVPPEIGPIDTDPSGQVEHDALVAVAEAESADGSVMVTEQVAVQPLSSVTVKVYVPAERPLVDGDTVYGAVPPVAVTEAEPSEPPKHDTLDTTEQLATSSAGSVIVTVQLAVQPLSSVTVYV
jgi:hypothetical protein